MKIRTGFVSNSSSASFVIAVFKLNDKLTNVMTMVIVNLLWNTMNTFSSLSMNTKMHLLNQLKDMGGMDEIIIYSNFFI